MFEIQSGLMFWTALSFIIMVFLLYRLVFPPLQKMLELRRKSIEGRLEDAARAQTEAEALLDKYRQQLSEAEKRSLAIFEEAERRSQTLREDALQAAQKEANQILSNAKGEMEVYRRKALVDLKGDITNVVVDVTRRLIKKELKEGDQIKLVESSIEELEKNAKS